MAQAIGWDDEINVSEVNKGDGYEKEDFVVLPPGEYDFKVVKFERGSYAGGEKIPACNKVKIGVVLDGGSKGSGYASTNFFMVDNQVWKIFQFLNSVGLRQQGTVSIPWSKVEQGVGELTGRCKSSNREYNGKIYTEVKTWIKSADEVDDMPEF